MVLFAKSSMDLSCLQHHLREDMAAFYMEEKIEALFSVCRLLSISLVVQPMFLFEGYLYHQCLKLPVLCLPLLFDEKLWRRILAPYDQENAIFVLHPTRDHAFQKDRTFCAEGTSVRVCGSFAFEAESDQRGGAFVHARRQARSRFEEEGRESA